MDPQCPCCGHGFETPGHITRCPNPGQRELFQNTVDKLLDWMECTKCDLKLIECLEDYLLSFGKGSMSEIAKPYPHLHDKVQEHNILGWDNFLKGRIGSTIFCIQRKSLKRHKSKMHIKTWAITFIQQVLHITHQQWLFRNARVHIGLLEGKTTTKHHEIMTQVLEKLSTSPDDLLPQHRHLVEVDFAHLGKGTTLDWQYWLATLESAIQAASHTRPQAEQDIRHRETDITNAVTDLDPT